MRRVRTGAKQAVGTVLLAATAVLSGCTGAQTSENRAGPAETSAPVILPGGPGDQPRVAGSAEVARLAEQDEPSQASVDYIRMMIPHHQQALTMTALAPQRARDPRVRALAERIHSAQTAEIGMMQGWLERHDLRPVADDRAQKLSDHHRSMMGMATREEMVRLESVRGTEFDRLFLKLMSTHHRGAVDMGVELLKKGDDPRVRSMAKDVMASQRDEIAVMQRLLAEIG